LKDPFSEVHMTETSEGLKCKAGDM